MGLYNELTNQNDVAAIDNVSVLFPLLAARLGIPIATGAYKTAKRINNINELKDKRNDWGIAYRSLSGNPKEAIKKLKDVQNGFVPNATNKFGGIDFVWGKYTKPAKIDKKGGGYGLAHIEGRRNEQGYNGTEFLDTIPNLFDNGMKYTKPTHDGRFYVGDGIQESVIRTDYNGKPRNWLDSSYYLEQ